MLFSVNKKHQKGFTQHHFFSRQKKSGAGFTLIELLITIAIAGIITAIIFTGLRNEQNRSAAKDAADRLQVELLGLQNKMQSAIALPTTYCTRGGGSYAGQGRTCANDAACLVNGVQGRCISGPPAAYGLSISISEPTVYHLFADMPFGTTPTDGQRILNASSYDQAIQTGKTLGKNIVVHRLQVNNETAANSSGRVDISFGGNNARIVIYKASGSGSSGCTIADCNRVKIVLRNTDSNVCYAISVNRDSGIVSKREFSACT